LIGGVLIGGSVAGASLAGASLARGAAGVAADEAQSVAEASPVQSGAGPPWATVPTTSSSPASSAPTRTP